MDLASSFHPSDELARFLDAGPPPVYIGFGSIVIDDPDAFTKLIFKAVEMTGVRALVSKGWGGLGDKNNTPENIFMLGNTPHDWLFPKVSAVVHHGGAGTTAIGLKCGRPTMIVPFFGDQEFWGAMVAESKAGARTCTPYKHLTAAKLAKGIEECLLDESKVNAAKIAESIAKEGDGAENAVKSFLSKLPMQGPHSMRCSVLEDRIAAWYLKACPQVHFSPIAAETLVGKKKLKYQDLRLLRHFEWNDYGGPGEPVTAVGGALVGSAAKFAKGVKNMPWRSLSQFAHSEHQIAKKGVKQQSADDKNNGEGSKNNQRHEGDKPDIPKEDLRQSPSNSDSRPVAREKLVNETELGLAKAGNAIAEGVYYISEITTYKLLVNDAKAIIAPVDLAMALAQGFHNAPRLYGDDTVRKPVRITGCHSGLRAAWSELVHEVSRLHILSY